MVITTMVTNKIKPFIELIDEIPKPVSIVIGIDILALLVCLPIIPVVSGILLIGIITVMVV